MTASLPLFATAAGLTTLTGLGLALARAQGRRQPLYLDAQATTPLLPEVAQALHHAHRHLWGNPGSPHALGHAAHAAVEAARAEVAQLGPPGHRVVFTSGATEALNLALLGALRARLNQGATPPLHVLTTAIEHKAVLQPLQALAAQGQVELELLPLLGPDGPLPATTVDLDALAQRLRPDTAVVALGWANNEVGTVQPLPRVAALLAGHPATLVVDATQAAAFTPALDVPERIDALACSAHKMHGPKGIGALLLRPGLPLDPLTFGGGQEGGLRPGTLPVPLIVGFGVAARLARQDVERGARLAGWAQAAWKALAPLGLTLNGPALPATRLPGHLSLTLPEGLDVATFRRRVPQLLFSQGSACSCSQRGSHVLTALGLTPEQQQRTFRLGFHAALTPEDARRALDLLVKALGG